ncbi:fatty acid transporter [Achromobacter xylosoxidans]|uniref:OmpP1/FadL family transporter n=1 Tax=Alcaligenes xylosoxydans xylosoxydans TaxID=85698 RepID=UPI00064D9EBD|nr:outer membrane protein transport protein [Achromobacter xylosoxidans]KMJ92360.1 fatty acid transporter [Achromobacter xylosoxidans]
MSRRSLSLSTLSAIVVGLGATSAAHGAGFQLLEQNASGLGNAYAGSAANPENASIIYYNPAGMTYLPGINVSGGVNLIKPSFKFSDNGDSRNPTALGGTRPTGGDGGDAGNLGVVPNLYGSWQLSEKWFIGLGIGAPFGLMTEYDDGWAGQYHSNKFEIKTININPSIAYKVNEKFSMGFGVNWQHIDANYKKKTVVPVALPGGRTVFTNGDADLNLKGDAWGWNVGFMLQPTEDTRIGLSYRSKIKHTAKGDTDIDHIGPTGQSVSFDAKASVDLPDTLILSATHQLNEKWELLGDISWTGWSSIPDLKIRNSGTGARDDDLPLNFRDTWRIAVGTTYKFAPDWKWKFGLAYDQSPVHKAEDRPTSLPNNDRYWFSTGVQWQATKSTTLDLGYTYLYLRKTDIDTTSGNALTKGRVAGTYDSSGHIFGLQLSSRF